MKKYYPWIPIIGIVLTARKPEALTEGSVFLFFATAFIQAISVVAVMHLFLISLI